MSRSSAWSPPRSPWILLSTRSATLAQEDIAEEDPNPYPDFEPVNIHLAMSLVPEEVAGFFELDQALYLPQAAIRDLDNEYRALTHSQLELIASRIAALNQCFY